MIRDYLDGKLTYFTTPPYVEDEEGDNSGESEDIEMDGGDEDDDMEEDDSDDQ